MVRPGAEFTDFSIFAAFLNAHNCGGALKTALDLVESSRILK
jgi:hypothetical protein